MSRAHDTMLVSGLELNPTVKMTDAAAKVKYLRQQQRDAWSAQRAAHAPLGLLRSSERALCNGCKARRGLRRCMRV